MVAALAWTMAGGATAAHAGAPGAGPVPGPWTIGFVPKFVGIPYFDAMRRGLEAASAAFGARLTYRGPTVASASDQIKIARDMVDQHLDAVGVSAASLSLLRQVAEAAHNDGVLFFSSDSQVTGPDVSLRVAPATADAIAAAVVAQIVAATGGDGDIALVTGDPTEANLFDWIVAVRRRIAAAAPGLRVVQTIYTGTTQDEATARTAELLQSEPAIRGVVGMDTQATAGAAAAVAQAGLAGRVAVTGLADPDTIRPFIRRGVVEAAVLWNPYDLGYLTVWGVAQCLAHRPIAPVDAVPGLPEPVHYDGATKTLVLGAPMVIDAKTDGLDF